MLIDWFTVAAQAVNFLILVGLLRWLLYGRIIDAMDRREERIASRLEEADQRRQEADRQKEEYERKRQDIERERESVLEDAHKRADERRSELLAAAREEADESREQWLESLRREKESFLQELRRRAGRETLAVARDTLRDMADAGLEERMAAMLARRLEGLSEDQRGEIVSAIKRAGGNVVIRSAFELPQESADRIEAALGTLYGHEHDEDAGALNVTREIEPELVCGVEIEAQGSKIGWSIDDHLDRLEEDLAGALEAEARRSEREGGEPEPDDKNAEARRADHETNARDESPSDEPVQAEPSNKSHRDG